MPIRNPSDFLPLTPPELLVLTMLSAGERHGYGLSQDIAAHTEGRVKIEAGNLYRTIRSLEQKELIEEAGAKSRADDERRIYYRLLPFGRSVLAAELTRLRALIEIGIENRVITGAG
jgi:DNA-binding PadR family transcriptional regulator